MAKAKAVLRERRARYARVDALYEERSDRVPGQTTLRLVAEDGAITPIGPRGTPRRRPHKRK